ncbi:MAG TPA: DNA mismatch repair protein MutS [Candidatus Dormibacteraeota bacterium]|nr:DNA mismatch repair protein MutS [Candidatus Dormibacteraeota bacterium]
MAVERPGPQLGTPLKPSPVLEQYLQVKREHPDAIVLFRLGDFYETFGEDAERVAPILGITLTSRELGKGQRFALAGVPYHAFEGYVGKLLRAGLRVALCDQVEDPAQARGLVRREVVRVLTPGMVVEEAYLESRANYAVAICLRSHHYGVAALDCSTGELALSRIEPTDEALRAELARLHAAELVVSEADRQPLSPLVGQTPVTWVSAQEFDARSAVDRLQTMLGVDTLAAYGCDEWPEALAAAGALLRHAERVHLRLEPGLLRLHVEHPQAYMHLDPATRRSLGLAPDSHGSDDLVGFILQDAITALGARELRRWLDRPLRQTERLDRRLDQVSVLVTDSLERGQVQSAMRGFPDLEHITARIGQGLATPRDLQALRRALDALPNLRRLAGRWAELAAAPLSETVKAIAERLKTALVEELPATLKDGGVFRAGFDAELDAIRDGSRAAREWIAALEQQERQRTGIRSLKVGFNQVFGYYLEISHANREAVPAEYVRKQTLVNGERYITPELKENETLVLNANGAIAAREQTLFADLCREISRSGSELLEAAAWLAQLDAVAALATLASRHRWVRPTLRDQPGIEIIAGRHPLVEAALGPGRLVPNDLRLDAEQQQIVLLSGPNMAGKSTFLRQAGMIVLLAQVGSFVPAARATIGLCDRIFTRVGAHDELARGLSTFMVEMVETAHILVHASRKSLLIFDEVGRGTSTYDGVSIAQAILEYLHDAPQLHALTLFATHYHELTALSQRLPRLRNFRMEVREEGERVIFLHQVVEGGADRSYGIHVAELAGLPRQVVVRARQVLSELEGQRPLERAEAAAQLSLPLDHPVVAELKQLDLEHLSPREALEKLYAWQEQHAAP